MRRRIFRPRSTTHFERFLLAAIIVLLPLEQNFAEYMPGGVSLAFVLFAILGGVTLVRNPITLFRSALHPIFLVAYLFLLLATLVETIHDYSDYKVIIRTLQMFAGGVVIASYCRDAKALRTALVSFFVMGIWMSVYLILSVFGVLSVASAVDSGAASHLRQLVFEDRLVKHNLNALAYQVAIGSAAALILWTTSKKMNHQAWLLVVALGGFVAVFLPMSRSGVFIALALGSFILFLRGRFRMRTLVAGLTLALVILLVVPDVTFSRMSFTFKEHVITGRRDGRAEVILASLEAIAEEPLWGVGTGNFWGQWGEWSSFYASTTEHIVGAHNTFAQIIIYWGLAPLLVWIAMFWVAYRCIPRPFSTSWVSIFLLTLFLWMFLVSMFSHNFYDKMFSIGLGILVGCNRWIQAPIVITKSSPRLKKYKEKEYV